VGNVSPFKVIRGKNLHHPHRTDFREIRGESLAGLRLCNGGMTTDGKTHYYKDYSVAKTAITLIGAIVCQ